MSEPTPDAHGARKLAAQEAAAKAEGWDEGYGAALGMARSYGHTDHWPDEEPSNPYLAGVAPQGDEGWDE